MIRAFSEDVYLQPCNSFNTAISDGDFPSTFIDVSDYERFAFIIKVGTLDSALTAKVQQATAAAGTGSKDVSGATVSIAADDDNELVTVEVETRKLDINNDFHFVTLDVAGAAGSNDYLDIIFVGLNAGAKPVTQPASYSQSIEVMG